MKAIRFQFNADAAENTGGAIAEGTQSAEQSQAPETATETPAEAGTPDSDAAADEGAE